MSCPQLRRPEVWGQGGQGRAPSAGSVGPPRLFQCLGVAGNPGCPPAGGHLAPGCASVLSWPSPLCLVQRPLPIRTAAPGSGPGPIPPTKPTPNQAPPQAPGVGTWAHLLGGTITPQRQPTPSSAPAFSWEVSTAPHHVLGPQVSAAGKPQGAPCHGSGRWPRGPRSAIRLPHRLLLSVHPRVPRCPC